MMRLQARAVGVVVLIASLTCVVIATQAPEWGAGALLYPARSTRTHPTPAGCEDRQFTADGVALSGWFCRSAAARRGTIVYLHGIADNRGSGRGVIARYTPRGFDVIAYDSRRHGESEGDVCTYGFYEKNDLRAVLDTLEPGPVIVIGSSLGAAVALQAAAIDDRISAVVAAEVFSDLRTILTERAPAALPNILIWRVFTAAQRRGRFDIEAVSPMDAAKSIHAPVLLIHGEADVETTPDHSRRVLDALAGQKRLILVAGVGHNHSLSSPEVWEEIDSWVEGTVRSGNALRKPMKELKRRLRPLFS